MTPIKDHLQSIFNECKKQEKPLIVFIGNNENDGIDIHCNCSFQFQAKILVNYLDANPELNTEFVKFLEQKAKEEMQEKWQKIETEN